MRKKIAKFLTITFTCRSLPSSTVDIHLSEMAFLSLPLSTLFAAVLLHIVIILPAIGETAEPTNLHSSCSAATTTAEQSSCSEKTAVDPERAFIMVKPDAVQRGLVAAIVGRLEQKGFQLIALKMVQADRHTLEQHYQG